MPALSAARKIFGTAFLGPDELAALAGPMGLSLETEELPAIPPTYLEAGTAGHHLLILGSVRAADGSPLTLLNLRDRFGLDPAASEPCFYNQDWYLKEHFASSACLEPRWYLLRREVDDASRGHGPEAWPSGRGGLLPPALLCAFAFFAYYLHTEGGCLWERDYVWCSDRDHQGDPIYVGRYRDPGGVNKNGFSVHRHLRIRECYGVAELAP